MLYFESATNASYKKKYFFRKTIRHSRDFTQAKETSISGLPKFSKERAEGGQNGIFFPVQ